MTKLNDVVNLRLLSVMLKDGYIRTQNHPELPYMIYNYTEKAQYERVWNEATLSCRGLIVDTANNKVLARPFRKFFNYDESSAPELSLDEPAVVTEKMDGSLGILYPTPGGHAIATRGSFTSEQAIHATSLWQNYYQYLFVPNPYWTYLFEIIYPENRIVCDYGDLDDLVLLGSVHIPTGLSMSPEETPHALAGGFLFAETFEYNTLAEALAAPDRSGKEGLVVHLRSSDIRVKIKQEDYVALHRIVTGLNARTVWEVLAEGRSLDALIEGLPDEFHPWVKAVSDELCERVENAAISAKLAYNNLVTDLPEGFSRKDFALRATSHPLKWALFMLLDGRDIYPTLWRNAKPEGNWTPSGKIYSEDVA